jgi:MoaA/NifB/PqqE/SkfB family radical SAM enzyme
MAATTHKPIRPDSLDRELRALLERMKCGETDGVEELRALLDRAPNSLEILGPLAWALANRGEHEESIRVMRHYLELQPGNVELHWRIGDRFVNLGQLDEALATYREVHQEHPDCEDARMGIRYVQYLQRSKKRKSKPYIPFRGARTERQKQNAALNEKEYEAGRIRLHSLPPRLYLESTLKCNFYCQTCSKGYGPYYAEDLQTAIFDTVRAEVMPTNVRISITGFGEPTMAGNFDEILQMALDNGSTVHFVTNASLLNYERIEKLTRFPVEITISIDGATKETFEEIRAGANYDLILEKLAMIKKLRDLHLSGVFSHYIFNFVAIRQNIQELPEVVRMAHRFGVEFVNVTDYAPNNNKFDTNSLRYEPENANQYLEEAQRVAEELGVSLGLPPPYLPNPPAPPRSSPWQRIRRAGPFLPEPKRFPQRCSSPWTEPYVQTDGTVIPCCASRQFLGDLKRQSFVKIWNGWRYRLLRWRIHTPFPPLGCRRCFVTWGINGGNASNVMAKEGLLIKSLYFLEIEGRRLGRWGRNQIRRIRMKLSRHTSAAPEPNFERGRPIPRQRSQPTTENQ